MGRAQSVGICEECGTEFPKTTHHRQTRFCSRTCSNRMVARTRPTTKGFVTSPKGYIHLYRPGHPMAMKTGYLAEHRLVMAEALGRMLLSTEVVDHINGIKNEQSAGESAGAVEEGARRSLEPRPEADGSLPRVRGALPASGSCGLCGGNLRALDPVPATILDCFAGSGTTGLVAQRLSRRAVLIDLSMEYLGQLMDRNRDIPLGLETA